MPTIAIVDGIRIVIYLNDHEPPHIHAFFSGAKMKVSIATGEILDGSLPRSKMRSLSSWLDANRDLVSYIWREIRAGTYAGGRVE